MPDISLAVLPAARTAARKAGSRVQQAARPRPALREPAAGIAAPVPPCNTRIAFAIELQ